MACRMLSASVRVVNARTRLPFRFGMGVLTAQPHLLIEVQAEFDGERVWAVAAEGLVPKWFTKYAETSYAEDLAALLEVIRKALELGLALGEQASPFEFWQELYARQGEWAEGTEHPPLLWNLGVTLVERAMIDGACRAAGVPFGWALRSGMLGVRPAALHQELEGVVWEALLPEAPLREVVLRHTVGLADPLTEADVGPGERVLDGLPQTLDECIEVYGLTHFKLKLSGDGQADLERLRSISRILEGQVVAPVVTLDGNEQYPDLATFASAWEDVRGDPDLDFLRSQVLFVEQPLPRDVALNDSTARDLLAWADRPPMIIDESDGEIHSARLALEVGYVGTSHKNCKGVFKSVANACLLAHRRRSAPETTSILSSEDLTTIGPVALLQDLAVVANLGITHSERNGHHYFRGLSMFPAELQEATVRAHPDLYRMHSEGFATLRVEAGRLQVGSVVDSCFGSAVAFDAAFAVPLDEWTPDSLTHPDTGATP
jgi:hypothetical protein